MESAAIGWPNSRFVANNKPALRDPEAPKRRRMNPGKGSAAVYQTNPFFLPTRTK
jgi:hypothetical protein